MCGIAGIYSQYGQHLPERPGLEAMAKHLHHRGPDGRGYYINGKIGLAHTRLSIIDLAGGAQPIHNETETVWIIFNGEIFNYIELRASLIALGHHFYTHTDTEVIVHLYEEYGEQFVSHLNGQFSIAVWDELQQTLILARDRVGITPLFYHWHNNQLYFASEIKAILAVMPRAPQLDVLALDQLMTYWSPQSPRTIFNEIEELPAGHLLVVTERKREIKRYWDWDFPVSPDNYWQLPEQQLTEQLHDLLVDATQIRLRADIPVGAYLSGGLDSSILLSLIHHHSNTPLRSFSLTFEESSLNESHQQKIMAEHLGTNHTSIACSNSHIANSFVDTIYHTETPVLRTAPAPMRMLSGLARQQGYQVVLTGEGADEVFGGYDIFKETKVRRFWAQQPQSRWRPLLLKRLYPYMDISSSQSHSYLQNFFGIGLDDPDSNFFSHLPRWDTTAKAKHFFSAEFAAQINAQTQDDISALLPDNFRHWHSLNRSQYIEAKSLMSGYLLSSQGDRMLMANSVEGRFPFLDHRVIEFANRLPPHLKIKVLTEKYLLRKSMAKYLPQEILTRQKQPYRTPDTTAFFNSDQAPPGYVDELLSEQKIRAYGYFDANKVKLLIKKARAGAITSTRDNQTLVGILSTQIWHFLFIENFSTFRT
jgi:asparagine synthase (glutamine-hydrolysing)